MDSNEKLAHDVEVLVAMAAEAAAYLDSDVLFWPLSAISSPKMTLGGYLMRQHRLLTLKHLLDEQQQAQVDSAVVQFNSALADRVVRFENKANHEMEARIRQFEAFLNDVEKGQASGKFNYSTAVEPRVMLTDLHEALTMPPYHLSEANQRHLKLVDIHLRNLFSSGDFAWPEEWQPAYPDDEYWYLYGAPRE